jgi:GH25 family lysozyme M1 (1,4-beta-N-acetylmuramidase)
MANFKMNGIDTSKWQGNIDWNKVKNSGVQFAILRAGYGRESNQKDECFERSYAGAKAAGLYVGAYHYSYAMTVDEAKKEAKTFLEWIKGKTFEMPVFFDLEESKQLALGKEKCTEIAVAFMETVEKAGYWVGLYMSKSPLETHISEEVRKRYCIWVAHYGVKKTTYNGQFGIWQKSSSGKINGISGNVDLNECYIDYPEQIKKAGLNGFSKKSETTTSAPKAAYFTYTVKSGDTLWDIAHKYLRNGSRYKEIMFASGITSETIYVGQKLTIPKY